MFLHCNDKDRKTGGTLYKKNSLKYPARDNYRSIMTNQTQWLIRNKNTFCNRK